MKKDVKPGTYLYPVPAVLVSCGVIDEDQNLITIAWTGTVASLPPQVGISIREERHSYSIIKERGTFVINLPTVDLLYALDFCGLHSGRDMDKFKETGLTPVEGKRVKTPVVKETPIHLECVVKEMVSLQSHDLFIGEIVHVEAHEELVKESGHIDFGLFKAITFMGGEYFSLGEALGKTGLSKT